MNAPRAAAVMAYRNGGGGRGGSAGSSGSNGFTSRAEVATIKGIGSKTFQQAVGFLRVTTSASSIEPAAPAEAAAARKISTRKERIARVLDGTPSSIISISVVVSIAIAIAMLMPVSVKQNSRGSGGLCDPLFPEHGMLL